MCNCSIFVDEVTHILYFSSGNFKANFPFRCFDLETATFFLKSKPQPLTFPYPVSHLTRSPPSSAGRAHCAKPVCFACLVSMHMPAQAVRVLCRRAKSDCQSFVNNHFSFFFLLPTLSLSRLIRCASISWKCGGVDNPFNAFAERLYMPRSRMHAYAAADLKRF